MSTWVIAVFCALAGLALGGAAANALRERRTRARFSRRVSAVDGALAQAVAGDRGWERERLEEAARAAFNSQRPGEEIRDLTLVQVIDLPGTDQDQAIFEVRSELGASRLTMGRRRGQWRCVELDDG